MKKLKDKSNIDKALILHWKTKQIEDLLGLPDVEDELLSSYENGLFETPVSSPKISPREMIYALSTHSDLSAGFIAEIKLMTKQWIEKKSSSWSDNVPPLHSEELEYILAFNKANY